MPLLLPLLFFLTLAPISAATILIIEIADCLDRIRSATMPHFSSVACRDSAAWTTISAPGSSSPPQSFDPLRPRHSGQGQY
ncbi:hypothetical protein B0T12DRAFT_134358 [Alternaria alternata]|nr:hypothetical protein B0T12DRAFT_134358 [Alternaria alternata]